MGLLPYLISNKTLLPKTFVPYPLFVKNFYTASALLEKAETLIPSIYQIAQIHRDQFTPCCESGSSHQFKYDGIGELTCDNGENKNGKACSKYGCEYYT
jgi:hypothetical protein